MLGIASVIQHTFQVTLLTSTSWLLVNTTALEQQRARLPLV